MTDRTRATRSTTTMVVLGAILVLGPAVVSRAESYAWVRTVSGAVTIENASVTEDRDGSVNSPLIAGDRLWVGQNARLEVEFPDRSLLRVEAGTRFDLRAVALEADSGASRTHVSLSSGSLQWVVPDQFLGSEDVRIDAANVTIYPLFPSTVRVTTDGSGWTEVVVRQGGAELATPRGTSRLNAGEAAQIDGSDWPRISLDRAGPENALERWARQLDQEALGVEFAGIEPELRYGAARLAHHGSWISVTGRSGWRPRLTHADWRPFVDGRWVYTSAGLTWVSSDPWGWTTSHYGDWDFVPGYGWVWFPGSRYAPARVYWHWGSSHVGWIPSGYYTRFYGMSFAGRFGSVGWANVSPYHLRDWNFCSPRSLRHRRLRDHVRRGPDIAWLDGGVVRGVFTGDTRGLGRDGWERPDQGADRLRRTAIDRGARIVSASADLPDLTDVVGRRRDVSAPAAAWIADARRASSPDGLADGSAVARGNSGRAASTRPAREPAVSDPVHSTRRDSVAPGRAASAGATEPAWSSTARAAPARPDTNATEPAWRSAAGASTRRNPAAEPTAPSGAVGSSVGSNAGLRRTPVRSEPGGTVSPSPRPATEPDWRSAGGGARRDAAGGEQPSRPTQPSASVRRVFDGLRPTGSAPSSSAREPAVAPPAASRRPVPATPPPSGSATAGTPTASRPPAVSAPAPSRSSTPAPSTRSSSRSSDQGGDAKGRSSSSSRGDRRDAQSRPPG